TGSSTGEGIDTLKRYFPDAVFRRNVIIGGTAGRYPADNFFPASAQDAGLTIPRDNDIHLSLVRSYAGKATDGRDPGADVDAIAKDLDSLDAAALRPRARAHAAMGSLPLDWRPSADAFFWIALVLLAYVYVGYPALAAVRARFWTMPRRRSPIEPS